MILPFLTLDLIFFGANILRVVEGGWVPLLVAAAIGLLIYTWVRGRGIVRAFEQRQSDPARRPRRRARQAPARAGRGHRGVPDRATRGAPGALLHNLKHNKVLHERNLIVQRPHRRPPLRRARTSARRSTGSTTISPPSC